MVFSGGALGPFVEFASTTAKLCVNPVLPGFLPLESQGMEPAVEQGSVVRGRLSLVREDPSEM